MKAYPKYKDSGVEWIGEIPESWNVKKLKYVSKFLNGFAFNSDEYVEEGVPIIRIGDIQARTNFEDCKKVPINFLEEYKEYTVFKGDLLLALTGATIGKSSIFDSSSNALLNQRVAIIRPIKDILINEFLKYLVFNQTFKEYIYYECIGGAQENIGKTQIGNYFISFPKKDEQILIAKFLDKQTQKIDSLIEKRKQMLELINENRSAIINNAVTKGINPKTKMKDSGVEWIGKIPESWDVKKLKYCDTIIMGQSPSSEDCNQENDGIPFLQGNADFGSIHPTPSVWCKTASKIVKHGDILLSVRAPIGAVNIANQDYGIGRGLCAVRAKTNNDKYLYYILICLNDELNSLGTGSTYTAISTDIINNTYIPSVKIPEQEQIVKYIETETVKIDKTLSQIEKEIALLQEYKTALISEAVTGKIEVQHA